MIQRHQQHIGRPIALGYEAPACGGTDQDVGLTSRHHLKFQNVDSHRLETSVFAR